MRKIIETITMFLVAITIFSGCVSSRIVNESNSINDSTRKLEDMLGREVIVPKEIKTVATIGSTARMLTYANCKDKIVGLSELEKTKNPGMPYAYVNADKFSELVTVSLGGANSKTYEEELAKLSPDIIFINYSDINAVNTLQSKLNIPVVALEYTGVFSESVYDALKLVGDIMGAEKRCIQLIESMKEWHKDLNNRTKDILEEDKPKVYAGAISFRGGHGIEGTYANYPPFVSINAKNVVDETKEDGSLIIEKEKLIVWDPDIIFLTPTNMNLVNEDYKKNKSFYDSLNAVKEGNVYTQINYNYFGTNIELSIVNAYYAGTVIYKDAFSDIEFEVKADEIFKEMLGESYMYILENSGNGFGRIDIGK